MDMIIEGEVDVVRLIVFHQPRRYCDMRIHVGQGRVIDNTMLRKTPRCPGCSQLEAVSRIF